MDGFFFVILTSKNHHIQFNGFLLLLLALSTCQQMNAQNLDDYQWKNRVLVLTDVAMDTEALQSQLQVFTADKEALADRDLIIFLVAENAVYQGNGEPSEMNVQRLRKNLGIQHDFRGTVLIGKDGGVKMREEFQVDPETVFDLIDGMPMRGAEMRKSGKS